MKLTKKKVESYMTERSGEEVRHCPDAIANACNEMMRKFNNEFDGEIFNIKTASLSGNLLDKSIISKKKVLFEVNGLEIISSSMEINQKGLSAYFARRLFEKQ